MSSFKSILKTHKEAQERPAEDHSPPSPAPTPEALEPSPPRPRRTKAAPAPKVVADTKRRGRPPGKRSDGEHVQVTAYIRAATHHSVKLSLLADNRGQEFSELVEELLSKWLKSRA